MKTTILTTALVLVLGLVVGQASISEAEPMGTAFTYQGRLMDANTPADGLYDLQFTLFDDPNIVIGNQIGSTLDVNDLDIIDGYFTVELDFVNGDPNVFNGAARWLETAIRPWDSNDVNDFVALSPRIELLPTPYAIYATTAGIAKSLAAADGSATAALHVKEDGNIGIGTAEPTEKLEVNGDIKVNNIKLANSDINDQDSLRIIIDEDNDQTDENFSVWKDGPAGTELFRIKEDGSVGIGTNTPGAKLEAVGSTPGSGAIIKASNFDSGDGVYGLSAMGNGVRGYSSMGNGVYGSSALGWAGYFEGQKNYFSGDVGIGIESPEAKLHINGDIKITDGSEGVGKVLTSDATGFASWQAPSGAETDPVYSASPAAGIVAGDITNWNAAFGWGDHSIAGYLTSYSESDPVYSASPAAGIASGDISNWSAAFGWGDHSAAGYLTSYTESDPEVGSNMTNYVPKWDGSALVTGTIYDNGNVGIGTTSPSSKLHIDGVSIGSNALNINSLPLVKVSGSNGVMLDNVARVRFPGGVVGVEGDAGVYLGIDGVSKLYVNTDGDVGIGTTSPAAKLDVNGQVKIAGGSPGAGKVLTSDATGLASWQAPSGAETDPVYSASPAAGIVAGDITNWNNAFGWGDHSTAGYLTSYTETDPQVGTNIINHVPKFDGAALVTGTIYDNGNVGIGTANPQSKLSVGGDGVANTGVYSIGSDTGVIGIDSDTGSSGRLGYDSYGLHGQGSSYGVYGQGSSYGVYGSGSFTGVHGTDSDTGSFGRLGYDNTGVYGSGSFAGVVGTDSDTGSYGRLGSGDYGVYASGSNTGVRGEDSDSGSYGHLGYGTWGGYFSGNGYFSGSVGIGTTSLGWTLTVNGSAAKSVGGTTWAVYSDRRLKEVYGEYEYGLSEVSKLNPVRYSYKENNEFELPTGKEHVGLVAQEVQDVIPEAVEENNKGYLMLNSDPIIWSMVNAIKELDAQNLELKAQNMELKQRLEALESRISQSQLAMLTEVQNDIR
ncbi:MAG: tail fiber domain-containing protein [Planctomycetota bacterium]